MALLTLDFCLAEAWLIMFLTEKAVNLSPKKTKNKKLFLPFAFQTNESLTAFSFIQLVK